MILEISVMTAVTATAAGLTWRILNIAKREGAASLLTARAGETLLHACLLFSWALLMREAVNVLLNSAPPEIVVGFGALFGGLVAMSLAGSKTSPVSHAAGSNHG